MARKTKGSLITIGSQMRPLQCLVCGGKLFRDREVMIGTHGFGTQASGLICLACGYLHTFVDGIAMIDYWDPEQGYPR